jgi:cellulose synthase/poly-beta-1,6-N-acetylglucosamine synthase-like glycosyltransferase
MWANILIIIAFVLLVPYCFLMINYRKWFLKLKQFVPLASHQPSISFSIIIPARNEENNIGKCLESVIQQQYPQNLFEIIVIDDHSTDNTSNIVLKYQQQNNHIRLIKLQDELDGKKLNAYKKKAIEMAISRASGDWIITTDADCILQTKWLSLYDEYILKNHSLLVVAPVMFSKDESVLSNFQHIDFMALQAATAATVSVGLHSMCNGANLAYNKNTFIEVGGFKGIDNIASGDDMLLMNKIKSKFPKRIGYLFSKEAIATTTPMPDWKSFLNQRIRWASKADKYEDKSLLPILLGIYLLNLFLFLLFFIGLFHWKLLLIVILSIIIKTIAEWSFMKAATVFFGKISFAKFLFLQPLHITYMVAAGWLGKFGNYQWKGRRVS